MSATIDQSTAIYSSLAADPDLGEIVELFVNEMPKRAARLRRQWKNRQWEDLLRTAHQLKGAVGSYGFGQITPFAQRLEDIVRQAVEAQSIDDAEIDRAVERMEAVCGKIRSGAPK